MFRNSVRLWWCRKASVWHMIISSAIIDRWSANLTWPHIMPGPAATRPHIASSSSISGSISLSACALLIHTVCCVCDWRICVIHIACAEHVYHAIILCALYMNSTHLHTYVSELQANDVIGRNGNLNRHYLQIVCCVHIITHMMCEGTDSD